MEKVVEPAPVGPGRGSPEGAYRDHRSNHRIIGLGTAAEVRRPARPAYCRPGQPPCYNPGMPNEVVFLKLGGSLITDKSRARAARPETIRHLADKITQARKAALSCSLSLTQVWILRAYRRKTRTLGEEIAEE